MYLFHKLIDILFNTKTRIKVLLSNIKMVTSRTVFRNLSWGTYIFFFLSRGGGAQELFEPNTSLKTKDFTDKGKWGLNCYSPPPWVCFSEKFNQLCSLYFDNILKLLSFMILNIAWKTPVPGRL